MKTDNPKKAFTTVAYLSLSPLLFSLGLAIYHAININEITDYSMTFARLNAFIFAHSYGALLLMLFAGIRLGQNLSQPNLKNILFNFMLLILTWISYQSLAYTPGMLLLLCCWIATFFDDFSIHLQDDLPKWYVALKLKLNLLVITMLTIILMLGQ